MSLFGLTFLLQALVVITVPNRSRGQLPPAATVRTPSEYFGGSDHEAYLQWYNENGTSYTGCLYLEAEDEAAAVEGNGVAVHWRVNETEELLYLSFAARAQDGWIGFGMAESGSMAGSDMVIYETAKPDILTDAYVLRENLPLIDDCQDWLLVSSINDGGYLIVEGVRKFDTKDSQDRDVIYDAEGFMIAQKIIAAWGNDTDTMSYHGRNRARGALRWFGTDEEVITFQKEMMAEATGFFELSVANYSIKTIDTEYVHFCFNWDTDIVPQGLNSSGNVALIAIEMVLDPIGKPYVHHAQLFAGRNTYNKSGVCEDYDSTKENYLYGWSNGFPPFRVPKDTGFSLGTGEMEGFRQFRLEVHYNNPNAIDGIKDNISVRLYYSTTPRTHEVGILLLGDPTTALRGSSLSTGLSKYTFDCSSKCSSIVLDEPVTVFAEGFHMHFLGSAGVHHHIRNSEVIRQTSVDFFDANSAGTKHLKSSIQPFPFHFWQILMIASFPCKGQQFVRQRPFQMNAGDSFSTSCYFDADNATTFGKGATEEMCLFNMLYFPAKRLLGENQWVCAYDVPFEACNAILTSDQYSLTAAKTLSSLEIDNFFQRDFGSISSSDGQCLPQPSIVATSTSSAFHVRKMNTFITVLLSATTFWQIYALVG